MGALRKIVDKILEGVDLSKPATPEKWKLMTKLGFRHTNEVELWSPYTNQAFSAPPVFSIDNLISIAQTRLDALVVFTNRTALYAAIYQDSLSRRILQDGRQRRSWCIIEYAIVSRRVNLLAMDLDQKRVHVRQERS